MKRFYLFLFIIAPCFCHAQNNIRAKFFMAYRVLEKNHISPLQWNDKASMRFYARWMEELDEEKLFFTRKEINILDAYKLRLDDEIKGDGWEFLSKSISLYKQRLLKTDSLIKVLTSKPFDFSKPDNLSWPSDNYAGNDGEWAQRWVKYLKWQVLNRMTKKYGNNTDIGQKLPVDFASEEIKIRNELRKRELTYIQNYLKSPEEFITDLENEYINTLAWCYDPHSNYLNFSSKNEFDAAASASEYSSGLDLDENEKGELEIVYLQPGSSAWRSGQLHKGDIIQSIQVGAIEKTVEEFSEEELSEALNGSSQTEIIVTVKTISGEEKKVTLHKEKITDDEATVKSYVLRGKQNIGYINLPGFYNREDESMEDEDKVKFDGCANDVSKEIVKLNKDTIAGLILDLRYNGGGSMWEAIQLAGIFIDIGPVASFKDRTGRMVTLKDPNRGTIYDGPLLVLINGASASASEFVSAALQDYNRALIVGGTTYGKGSAQFVMPLDTLAQPTDKNKDYKDFIKITSNKFYRINGNTTQWQGVVPDIFLPDYFSDERVKEKSKASALLPDNSKVLNYKPLPLLPVKTLAAKSAIRVNSNNHFKQLNDFISWISQYNSNRNIPLQWKEFMKQHKEIEQKYKEVSKPVSTPEQKSVLQVSNNGFDWKDIMQASERGKSINKQHIKQIAYDEVILEAYHILMDWNGK